ncbi:MAG: hypothetical protein ACKOBM_08055 [Gammaproteobacteria bacterium]
MAYPRLPQDTERSEQRATLDDPSECACECECALASALALAPAGAEPGTGSRP